MQESNYLEGRTDLLKKLKSIPALQSFEDSNLLHMLSLSKLRRYEPREMIIAEGENDCWMFFLISGEVKVEKDFKEIVRLGQYGDMFGEMSMVDGAARSASVISISETVCLAMDASIMDRVAPEKRDAFHMILYRFIAAVLADRLRQADVEIAHLRKEVDELKGKKTLALSPKDMAKAKS